MDNRKVHFKNKGCRFSMRIDQNSTDNISLVTCTQCVKIIKRHHLKPLADFPRVPTFKAEHKPLSICVYFRCPVCGELNIHGGGSGHRVSDCGCWIAGYEVLVSAKATKVIDDLCRRWTQNRKRRVGREKARQKKKPSQDKE